MHDLFVTFFAVLAGIVLYRYHRNILDALKRFDDRNRARIDNEARDKADSLAHFRHTLRLAEEQVEQIDEVTLSDPRTAMPVTCYVFSGEHYATRRDAERAREDRVRAKARSFYMELPRALASHDDDKLGRD